MATSYLDNSYLAPSELNYTKYTDESAMEDSFEIDQKMDTLLSFNKHLLDGFNNFISKDIPGLIVSYQKAHSTLEKGTSPNHQENLLTIKANLAVAYYFNNEIDKAIHYTEEALKLISQNGRSMDRQVENIQSLYMKCLVGFG